jgi:AcrR family transcriptional regulator
MAAAAEALCAGGYLAVSVEDIAAAAGLSRVTFYRHFASKTALAVELFREAAAAAMPRYMAIAAADAGDPAAVGRWVAQIFAADRLNRRYLRVFSQAAGSEPAFTERAQELIADIIAGLGASIPAFALRPDAPADRRRWLEAWLLIYEILDQSNHAALDSGVAHDPLVIDILASRFLAFVQSAAAA